MATNATPNPAALLEYHLRAARALKSTNSNGGPLSAVNVWSRRFECDGSELARRMADLMQLSAEIRSIATVNLRPQVTVVDAALIRFERGFLSLSDHVTFEDYWNTIDGGNLVNSLSLLTALLDGADELHLTVSDAGELAKYLRGILDALDQAELSEEQARHVESALRDLIDYLDNSGTRSTGQLKDLFVLLAGRIIGDRDLARDLNDTPVGRAVLSVIVAGSVLIGVTGWLSVAQGEDRTLPPPEPIVLNVVHSDAYDTSEVPALPRAPEPKELPPGTEPDNNAGDGK